MDMYAQVLKAALAAGKRVAPGVHLYIQFGSQDIRRYAEAKGYLDIFERAGAELVDPSCGACIKAGPGVSDSPDQVTVSAITAISLGVAALARCTSPVRSSWQRALYADGSHPPRRSEMGTTTTTTIGPNAHVVLEYVLRDDAGAVLDESEGDDGEPIIYVHGYGMLVPGLEAELVGMKVGDEREIIVSAEEGFGKRDEELVLEVEKTDFPDVDHVAIGDEFVATSPEGDELVMTVLEVKPDCVIVDANHPLAGQRLHYSVKVREVRAATDQEISEAAQEFEDAQADHDDHEHVHGPDCAHDHDHAAPAPGGDLVALRTKGKTRPLN